LIANPRKSAFSAAIVAGAIVISLVGSASPAHAFGTMTAAQWNADAGTVALHAAMDKNDSLLAGLNVLDLSMTIEDDGSVHSLENITVRADKTSAVAKYSSTDLGTGEKNAFDYYFKNGTYIESVESFQSGPTWVNDIDATLKRIGRRNIVAVNDHTATKLQGLPNISPTAIWSNADRDPFLGAAQGSPVLYGPVYTGTDAIGSTNVVYSWSGDFTADVGIPVNISLTASNTFNSDGLMIAQSLTEDASPYFKLTMSQTLRPAVDTTMDFPVTEFTVDASTLIKFGHQVDAEKTLAKPAASLVKKAKALAKGKVASSHIVSAAKSLKLKYKSVKNGVKLSAVSAKVTGSLCVVASNGKAVITPCS